MGLLDFFRKEGYDHEKVGSLIQSDFFSKTIIVTRFISDDHWYFKTYDFKNDKADGIEERAKTKFTYFVLNDKVLRVGK